MQESHRRTGDVGSGSSSAPAASSAVPSPALPQTNEDNSPSASPLEDVQSSKLPSDMSSPAVTTNGQQSSSPSHHAQNHILHQHHQKGEDDVIVVGAEGGNGAGGGDGGTSVTVRGSNGQQFVLTTHGSPGTGGGGSSSSGHSGRGSASPTGNAKGTFLVLHFPAKILVVFSFLFWFTLFSFFAWGTLLHELVFLFFYFA